MFKIGNRTIGNSFQPYLIAEMSGNHNQSLERALQIVEEAARSGADAIKLQTYTAETMTLDTEADGFVIKDPASLWSGRKLFDLYREAFTPWEWHRKIFERSTQLGMQCFSSPFDDSAVDFLESLNVPAYKIASFELTDLPLVKRVAATGKPMIMSTGMATLGEIDEALQAARAAGCREIALLKCTSTYPASPENSNLLTIPNLRNAFDCEVGLSDHTMGCGVAIAAVALGASLIEKHFTLRRSDGGVDASFSLEPAEFAALRIETDRAWRSLGKVTYGGTAEETKSKIFRRSIYVIRELMAGHTLETSDLRVLRPGLGLAPRHIEQVVGRRLNKAIPAGTPLQWTHLV
jgi:N-acetylneuraminate synthase